MCISVSVCLVTTNNLRQSNLFHLCTLLTKPAKLPAYIVQIDARFDPPKNSPLGLLLFFGVRKTCMFLSKQLKQVHNNKKNLFHI